MLPTSVYAQVQRTNPSRIYSSTHRRGRCYAQLNYYEVLGVEVDASEQDIKAAFRRQAKVVHPDVNPAADAAETFRTLKRAHEVLSNRMLRQEHDTKLALPSAQAKDPRFARFYRWRREVIPDLEIALDEWTEQVNGIVKSADKELWDMERQCLQLLRGQLPVSIEPTAAQEAAAAMISSMQGLIQDAGNNIKRQHSKRYEQVQVRCELAHGVHMSRTCAGVCLV